MPTHPGMGLPSAERQRPARRLAALACALWVGVAALSCGQPRKAPERISPAGASRVDVFLRAGDALGEPLSMVLESVHLRDADGQRSELTLQRSVVRSDDATSRVLVAGDELPPATYVALELWLRAATLGSGERERELRLLPEGPEDGQERVEEPTRDDDAPVRYEVPLRFTLGSRDAASVFLDWDVAASLIESGGFRPVLGVTLETPQVRLGLLYVADEASGSVLAVDRATGQVTASGKVGAGPRALALSSDRRQLFVANAGDGSLSFLDLQRHLSEFTVPIRLSAGCADVVVVERGRLVAVANQAIDTVTFVDLRTAAREGDVRVGRGPERLLALPDRRRLFVVNSGSDAVSVIDVASRAVVASLAVESAPSAIAADRRGRELFVVHRNSPNLLVFDADSLQLVDTLYVGADATAVLADNRRDRMYVARSHPAEIAVVDRRLRTVLRRIPVSSVVTNLAQPLDGALLYGSAPEAGALMVIDVVVFSAQSDIPCGAAPVDVVAIE